MLHCFGVCGDEEGIHGINPALGRPFLGLAGLFAVTTSLLRRTSFLLEMPSSSHHVFASFLPQSPAPLEPSASATALPVVSAKY